MTHRSAVIIGGGISGLSAALFLSLKASRERLPLKITILEATDRLGGVLRTLSHGDLRMEAGADAFYGGQDDTLDLCRELGLQGDVIEAAPCFRDFFYLENQKSFRAQGFPGSWGDVLRFLFQPRLGWGAKCRLFTEPCVPREYEGQDESVAHFMRRRLGEDFYREVVKPLVRGVYLADPERASVKALFPKWRQAEQDFGSLAGALLKTKRGNARVANSGFYTLKQGLEGLAGALERELAPFSLRRSTAVRECVCDQSWKIFLENGAALDADILGLAVNAPDSARLLSVTAPELSRRLADVRYDSLATVIMAYRSEDVRAKPVPTGFWVPADDKPYPFSSFKWLGASADGKYVLARAFVSEAMAPDLFHQSDEALRQGIAVFAGEFWNIPGRPYYMDVGRYPKALPQYEVGHLERVSEIDKGSSRFPGLFLTGNGFEGFGITDCVHRAKSAVSKLSFAKGHF